MIQALASMSVFDSQELNPIPLKQSALLMFHLKPLLHLLEYSEHFSFFEKCITHGL